MVVPSLDELVAVERQGWDALCSSTGSKFYGELMTADAVMILVNGMVMDRDTVVASLNDSPPWNSYELHDARVVPVGAEAAALVYRAVAHRAEADEPFEALMSSVYVLVDGTARLALYQQTGADR